MNAMNDDDRTVLVTVALLGAAGLAWWALSRDQRSAQTRAPPQGDWGEVFSFPQVQWGDLFPETIVERAPVPAPAPVAPSEGPGFIEQAWARVTAVLKAGEPEPVAVRSPAQWRAELQPLFRQQEARFSMPRGLLEAIADRESRFRHDIITGELVGGVGEQGIMQLHPAYHLTAAERLDPYRAIPYAASYLADQYIKFGTWAEAIAAYNWGPGNVSRAGIQNAPAEVKEYIAWVQGRGYTAAFV